MKDVQQKIAYLQGLADGLELDDSTKEGKIINGILEVLDEIGSYLGGLDAQQDDLEDYLECLDSDLSDVEDVLFGEEEDDEAEDDDEADDYVDVECPNCHKTVSFDASILYDDRGGDVICPYCGAVVFNHDDEFVECDGQCAGCDAEECDDRKEAQKDQD